MEYSHRYLALPTQEVAAALDYHIDIHRQAYNYTRYEYTHVDADNIGSAYKHHDRLTEWKDEFPVFAEVHSKALQRTVTRFYQNLSNLSAQKENGNSVGMLKWKSPREYQSVTYSQSGFELKNTSGRTARLWLSKIGEIPIRYHREIPDVHKSDSSCVAHQKSEISEDEADIKEVTIKKETTGEWFVSFGLETDDADLPEKPALDTLDASNSVGVDLGIRNYIQTSDGTTVDWIDLSEEYERLRREQRKLSRKEKGSNNYEKQRKQVAEVKRHIRRKVLDYQHKLTTWLVREYDAVFVEDLNVKGMLEQSYDARNKQDAAWRQFITLLEYKADLYGCHVKQVEAAGTTKECARCGVETAKPIWVREHSCPSCGFEADRDANAVIRPRLMGSKIVCDFATAMNVLQRGFAELGLGWPEDTPVETALPTDTTQVSAKRVRQTTSGGLSDSVSLITSLKQEAPLPTKLRQ